jgi:hypothetical protein
MNLAYLEQTFSPNHFVNKKAYNFIQDCDEEVASPPHKLTTEIGMELNMPTHESFGDEESPCIPT